MNQDFTNKTTKELITTAKNLYVSLPNDQAELQCAPYIEEINKRMEAIGSKYSKLASTKARMPRIRTIHDLIKFRN